MESAIQRFMDILAGNVYTAKYKDIPEEIDNRDEIIAEIQSILDDDGLLPDSLRFFELNGKSSTTDLTQYLLNNFQKFKIEFLAGKHSDNDSFKTELYQQLDMIKKDIEQKTYEAKQLKDENLIEMLNAKSRICAEVLEFITSHSGTSDKLSLEKNQPEKHKQTSQKKESKVKRSFKWLKEENVLIDFHSKMILNGLIAPNTDIEDFKAVFSNVPVSQIDRPVHWEKGAKLFAYFFIKLIENKYIPQKPSWINLSHLFTYIKSNTGKPEPILDSVKTNVTKINTEGVPKDAEVVDILFNGV